MRNDKILIVVAHPDDEVIGCGATISRLSNEGAEIYTLILGEGKTSRSNNDLKDNYSKEKLILKNEALIANKIIGVKDIFYEDYPDNRFDSVDLIDVVKSIENIKCRIKPNIIFTHFMNDLNIDHRVTYNAVLTATRPMIEEDVCELYSFEVLSSTEWNYPISFSPNVFFNVTDYFDNKLKAMQAYNSELKEYPHSRSLKALEENAKTWAFKCGINGYVESFYLNRMVIK